MDGTSLISLPNPLFLDVPVLSGLQVKTEWKLILEDWGHVVTRIAGSGRPENP
jgi:hypothetical protein